MAFSPSAESLPARFRLVLNSFLQQPGLPFADVLPEDRIQTAFDEQGVAFAQEEDAIYTPQLTLWASLSQVLFQDEQRSCLAAVSRVIVLLVALGQEPPSDNTGAYCRAVQAARGGHSSADVRGGRSVRVRSVEVLALAWAAHEVGRRQHMQHARHRRQSGRVSAANIARGGSRFSAGAIRGLALAGHRNDQRPGHRALFGERDR